MCTLDPTIYAMLHDLSMTCPWEYQVYQYSHVMEEKLTMKKRWVGSAYMSIMRKHVQGCMSYVCMYVISEANMKEVWGAQQYTWYP